MAEDSLKEKRLRTFLALPLAEHFLHEITEIIHLLKSRMQGVKWVLPEHVHVTLHFFGPTSADEVQVIKSAVAPVAGKYSPFSVGLQGIGFFPNPMRPRVIWIGLAGETAALGEFQSEIERQLKKAGFVLEDRPFRAHATIGRVKEVKQGMGLRQQEDSPELKSRFFTIQKIQLFQSVLGPEGARYVPLETFYLSGKPGS